MNDLCFGKIQAPRFKPWFGFDDHKNVFFVSVHGYGPRESGLEHLMPHVAFYPGSGATVIPDLPAQENGKAKVENISKNHADAGFAEGKQNQHDEDDEAGMQSSDDEDDNNMAGGAEGEEESDDADDANFEDQDDDDDNDEDSEVLKVAGDNVHVTDLRRIYVDKHGKPLILDVGVSLPGRELSPAEYRHHWRNYFRYDEMLILFIFKSISSSLLILEMKYFLDSIALTRISYLFLLALMLTRKILLMQATSLW
jgi:hypothetical protein